MKLPTRSPAFILTSAIASLLLSHSAHAATRTWTGANGSGNWSVGGSGGNWNNAAAPVAADLMIFDGTNHLADNNNDLTADLSFGNISFAATAGAFTLSGNRITMGGNITNSSTNLQTINLDLILSNNRTVAATAGDITIGGAISGTGFGVTTSGVGRVVTFTGSNSYTGGTTISSGTLKVGSTSALGGAGSSFSITNGGTLHYSTDTAANNYLMAQSGAAGGSNRTIILDRATVGAAVNQTITSLGVAGAATGGGETITANVGANVTSGIATLFIDTVNGNIGGSSATNTTTVSFAGTAAYKIGDINPLTPAAARFSTWAFKGTSAHNEVTGAIVDTISGGFTNRSYITVDAGVGTWKFSGTNTNTGTTTVATGTAQFAKVASLYNGASASWTPANIRVASGATLAFNVGGTGEFTTTDVTALLTNLATSSNATTNGMAAGSNIGFDTTNASGGFTIADVVANTTGTAGGARGLVKLGTGTLILNNANTYSGATTINTGTLLINNASGSGTGTSVVTVNDGGRFGGTGFSSSVITVADGGTLLAGSGAASEDLSLSGNVTFAAGSNIEIALGASGSHSSLTRTGGTWVFDANQTFNLLNLSATTGLYDNIISGLTGSETGLSSVSSWVIANDGWTGTFAYDGTGGIDLTVTSLTSIPEPSSFAALAGGLLAAFAATRRRR